MPDEAVAPRKVLFVTNDAGRTGSPVFLLRLLTWVGEHTPHHLDLLCLRGGPLLADFDQLARVVTLDEGPRRSFGHAVELALAHLGLHRTSRWLRRARLRARLGAAGPWDVAFLNGTAAFAALGAIEPRAKRVIGHIHELPYAMARSLPPDERSLLGEADLVLAVAPVVRDHLVDGCGLEPDRVRVRPGFVSDPSPDRPDARPLRACLAIPPETPIVGGVGEVIERKGPDLFVEVATGLARRTDDVHFVWVGAGPDRALWAGVHASVERAGLGDRIHFVGEQADAMAWLALFDVLLLTSREDPFPLVCLEAGSVGTPTVAFAQGGAPGFIAPPDQPPAGRVVPAFDVDQMVAATADLLADAGERTSLGALARRRVAERYHERVVVPEIVRDIERLAES